MNHRKEEFNNGPYQVDKTDPQGSDANLSPQALFSDNDEDHATAKYTVVDALQYPQRTEYRRRLSVSLICHKTYCNDA